MTKAPRPPLGLGEVFLGSLGVLAVLLGLLFYLLVDGSRRSILEGAEALRRAASERIAARVQDALNQAQKAVEDVEAQVRNGALRPGDALSLESGLFAQLLANPDLAEVTLTLATSEGHGSDGRLRVASTGRWQLSVFRSLAGRESRILTRVTRRRGAGYESEVREPLSFGSKPVAVYPVVEDPTLHPTFETPASVGLYGTAVWTDLHRSELDSQLPEAERRVVVAVMKAIEDRGGAFVGVLRAGLLTQQVDAALRVRVNEADPNDPHRIFLCDERGALLSRVTPRDRLEERGDDLRWSSDALPAEVAAALAHPALSRISPDHLWEAGQLESGGRNFFVTYRDLERTQGWRLGIVVPEDYYLSDARRAWMRLLGVSVTVVGVILVGGVLTLRSVRRSLGQIVESTARLRRFEFQPSPWHSPFRDVAEVMDGLELAKTAMRAMGKYVPVDLVRHLYLTGREPVLGGEPNDVSLLFTDIEGFTTLSERLAPNDLALVLGRYLEVMTAAIHQHQGVIDKYIGDAVMAVWNAPSPCADHARAACRAALACVEATRGLFASPEWAGRPPLVTRFGLHRDTVLVGHFGAPDRMSYTALGDGVNLASRLEGLNKAYGTRLIASETIRDAAAEEFEFRLLDLVAVKGKTRGVRAYELLGRRGEHDAALRAARVYEQAFDAYLERRFAEAERLLEACPDDAPSRLLVERCRRFRTSPPPPGWDGTFTSTSK